MGYPWTQYPYVGSASQFANWGQGISTALGSTLGCRLVKVSDDGVVASNWPLVIPNWSAQTYKEWAWEVWQFPTTGTNGATQQGASPIYIRVGYGTGSSSSAPLLTMLFATSPENAATKIQIGSTSPAATLINATVGNNSSNSQSDCWAAGDGDGFVLALSYNNVSGSSNRTLIVVDRHRNPNGTAMPSGLAFFRATHQGTTLLQTHFDLVDGEASTLTANVPCITQGNLSTTDSWLNGNGEVQLYPWWSITKNSTGLLKMVCTYQTTGMQQLQSQQVSWLPATGSTATRTVKALGSQITSNYDVWDTTGVSAAIWWSDP